MRQNMGLLIFIGVISVIFLLLDLYTYKGLKLLIKDFSPMFKYGFRIFFWGSTIAIAGLAIYVFRNYQELSAERNYFYFNALFTLVILSLIPKLIFSFGHMINDIVFYVSKLRTKPANSGDIMTRSEFITKVSFVAAAIPFTSILYGMFVGRFNFRVIRQAISFEELPQSFDGLRIVHISDMHIGSFYNNFGAVQKGIDMINELDADYVVFTGDMVNNYAEELEGWIPYLSKIKAKKGKFSILGNHDYGDYAQWNSKEDKMANLELLKKYIKETGFQLLLNENVNIDSGSDTIKLVGLENWGHGRFSKYGDLQKSMQDVIEDDFTILLSHDPSHWDEQVLGKTNINLALAGHTHGMQFGVTIGNVSWSPSKYRYPRWGGLYTEGKQHLYVNRGFGYLGLAARIGMPPEITLLELKKA